MKVYQMFSAAHTGYPSSIWNATLQQALAFKGGSGVNGGAQILIRAGVAAVLNAQANIGYPLSVSTVISDVNGALATHNRATILALASTLDGYNNLPHTFCPGTKASPSAPAVQANAQTSNSMLALLRSLWNSFVARLEPTSATVLLH
jgi:hypothetical protein